ncbi:DNA-3-methyladenine glycosylase family protein [Anaerostipes sp.]|uniref:DNA-3-methyladenine glycosylase family protein n=1 Tax=Anaerostipes sp. TaxID=1872530 RepID=UPI0025C26A2D|nr:DNA-3-methyladenine glycosylase 2 family protein [Anaerostipes sp.]MBS7007691.1 DNA-3-methyladenine glycosylase 2 family protein [Anaerostipes sp.]
MEYFIYGEQEIEYLKSRDPVLGQAMDRIGMIKREVHTELFAALVNSIVGQQISTKAQITVWNRMKDGLLEITPETVARCTKEELQSFGISFRKAEYIKTAAERVQNKSLDLEGLKEAGDEQVRQELTKLPGVGVWTAEMLMIFSMQRPDIVSYSDLAIQRGMRMLYHHRAITPKLFKKYTGRYSPCGTVASLYLWAVAGGAIPEMKDYAPKKKK